MNQFKVLMAMMVLSSIATAQATKPGLKPPTVTELQRVKLENASLRQDALKTQYDVVLQQKGAIMAEIAKDNPGYYWVTDERTHQDELVPIPEKPTVKPAAKK